MKLEKGQRVIIKDLRGFSINQHPGITEGMLNASNTIGVILELPNLSRRYYTIQYNSDSGKPMSALFRREWFRVNKVSLRGV